MERYLRWFARLGRFYQIILTVAVLVGLLAIAVSAVSNNPLFTLVGVLWLVGGSAVVWIADRRERA